MKLYHLRRAIRCHAEFGNYPEFNGPDADAAHLGAFIDFAARDIYELPIQDYPIQPMNWQDDGYDRTVVDLEPLVFRVWDADSPPPVAVHDRRITVSPERRKYADGKGRHMLVVFGIADNRFFIWKLGGLQQPIVQQHWLTNE